MPERRVSGVARLREDQIDLATGILSRAFFDDPPLVYAIPQPAERSRSFTAFFRTFVSYARVFGDPLTTGDPAQAVAIWFLLNSADDEDEQAARRAGIYEIPAILGADCFRRLQNIISLTERFHRRCAPEKHLYLQWLGVEPSRQGQGLGSALLHPVLERADSERLPCYLETFKPRNLPLYQRHGFEILLDEVEPQSGCRGWAMLRAPR